MSLTSDASLLVIFARADANVVVVTLGFGDANAYANAIVICPLPCTLFYNKNGITVTCLLPQKNLFVLKLSFVDAVFDDGTIICFHVDCSVLIFFLKMLGG
jgi:hypothetical protein